MAEKNLPNSIEAKRLMIEPNHPKLSIRRQCDLIGLNRSSFYWQPASESPLNLARMRLINEEYTRAPFYGYRKMTAQLRNPHGYLVNHKRVARLMGIMGHLFAATNDCCPSTAPQIPLLAAGFED
ncbi:MAG: transposase [Ardenticatenaceae bacterium]|nr:transposase [Ardenticatenaceae bacterium]